MDFLSLITAPVKEEIAKFNGLFSAALTHEDDMLSQALGYISRRSGKRMRPMLTLLVAKNYGIVGNTAMHAAVALELLHTASLVHDDVVDNSDERRGQASVNAEYSNKVAVLVGDYLLSTALLHVAQAGHAGIVSVVARLGQTLSSGEMLQLSGIRPGDISEQTYYEVIRRKTASLFEACCTSGALAAGASAEETEAARMFGQDIGMIFQIRDDIFDYFEPQGIGKPTGNDMSEGKLTLPAIYVINSGDCPASVRDIADKVRRRNASDIETAALTDYVKRHGGVEYAEKKMREFRASAQRYIDERIHRPDIREALQAYLDMVIMRDK